MATVTGFTAQRMLAIEEGTVVSGSVVDGRLILVRKNGTQIDAGSVTPPTTEAGAMNVEVVTGSDLEHLAQTTVDLPAGTFIVANPNLPNDSSGPIRDANELGLSLGGLYFKTGNMVNDTYYGEPTTHSALLNLSGSVSVASTGDIDNLGQRTLPAGTLVYAREDSTLYIITGWEYPPMPVFPPGEEPDDWPAMAVYEPVCKGGAEEERPLTYIGLDEGVDWLIDVTVVMRGYDVDMKVSYNNKSNDLLTVPAVVTEPPSKVTISLGDVGGNSDDPMGTFVPVTAVSPARPAVFSASAFISRQGETTDHAVMEPLMGPTVVAVPYVKYEEVEIEPGVMVGDYGRYVDVYCNPADMKAAFEAHEYVDLDSPLDLQAAVNFAWHAREKNIAPDDTPVE